MMNIPAKILFQISIIVLYVIVRTLNICLHAYQCKKTNKPFFCCIEGWQKHV